MSTYSNDPQQNKWEIWFLLSTIIFISLFVILTSYKSEKLPIWFDALTFLATVNLIYCLIIGFKK